MTFISDDSLGMATHTIAHISKEKNETVEKIAPSNLRDRCSDILIFFCLMCHDVYNFLSTFDNTKKS